MQLINHTICIHSGNCTVCLRDTVRNVDAMLSPEASDVLDSKPRKGTTHIP